MNSIMECLKIDDSSYLKITYTQNGAEFLIKQSEVACIFTGGDVSVISQSSKQPQQIYRLVQHRKNPLKIFRLVNWPMVLGFRFPTWARPHPFYLHLTFGMPVLMGVASVEVTQKSDLPVLNSNQLIKILREQYV